MENTFIMIAGFIIFALVVGAFGLLLSLTKKEINKINKRKRGIGITEGPFKNNFPKVYDDITKIKTAPPPPIKSKTLNV
jgi:hypothetical protein